jgi:seryl-tRNA synthetase
MSEKKTVSEAATSKTTAKKKRAKKKSAKRAPKETNPVDVRKSVSKMAKSKAMAMAKSVIGETEKGEIKDLQLATVKYLFEMAEIYPPQADQDTATADEDCLAKTLLNRLNIPDEPIRRDEDEEEVSVQKSTGEAAVGESATKDPVAKVNEENAQPERG